MGSTSSNTNMEPTPKQGIEMTNGTNDNHQENTLHTNQEGNKTKEKKGKRKTTLDPQYYQSKAVKEAKQNPKNLLNFQSKLTASMKSIRSGATPSDFADIDDTLELIDFEAFEYPFENAIFEGGGSKGLAYAGAIQEFERIGVWKNIKRLGGASAGAMTATLLAIGYNSHELKEFLSLNLQDYFLDATCGSCSLLPNLVKHFGWHPARRLFEWFGDRLEERTGDADVTFKQLYDTTGKELCIVVTNLNRMDTHYCHVKTTPDMPIRTAVRMSLAIPGLFGPVKSEVVKGKGPDCYVDGGVLCNYPIHCFDGWWLSLKPADSMFRRLQPLEDIGRLWDKKERFGSINPKTIGFLLYSSDEQDIMVSKLKKRKTYNVKRPDTKLSTKRIKLKAVKEEAIREHKFITSAMSNFLRLLAESDIDESGTISRKELIQAFHREVDYFPEAQRRSIFGDDYNIDDIFDAINGSGNEITYRELLYFAERRGVAVQSNFEGYARKEIRSFKEYLGALTETLLVNVKRIFTRDDDIDRTIGIDTVYVDTTDFTLEEGDIQFLFKQGQEAVRSYLRNYVRLHDPPRKKHRHDMDDILGSTATGISNIQI